MTGRRARILTCVFLRIRQQEEEEEASLGTRCCYGFLYTTAQIFLHAPVGLILYWIIQYKQHGKGKPFAWRGGENNSELELTWNLHPFLMVTGLVYFMGQGRDKEGTSSYFALHCLKVCSNCLYRSSHLQFALKRGQSRYNDIAWNFVHLSLT